MLWPPLLDALLHGAQGIVCVLISAHICTGLPQALPAQASTQPPPLQQPQQPQQEQQLQQQQQACVGALDELPTWQETTETIDRALLMEREPILFFDEVRRSNRQPHITAILAQLAQVFYCRQAAAILRFCKLEILFPGDLWTMAPGPEAPCRLGPRGCAHHKGGALRKWRVTKLEGGI